MEELIIDCRTKKETRRRFTKAEETERLAELEKAQRWDIEQQIGGAKQELARVAGDLAQVKGLQGSGFVAADIGGLERRRDELQQEITRLSQQAAIYHSAAGGVTGAASGIGSFVKKILRRGE